VPVVINEPAKQSVRMVEIVIENLNGKRIFGASTTRPLLYHAQQNYIDWMHSCGGKGRCTTCKVIIVSGSENLAPLTVAEETYKANGALGINERLACQVVVTGQVTVRIPDEGKLPHMHYSDDPQ
jgi:ferredoxin, 2Fe-2S